MNEAQMKDLYRKVWGYHATLAKVVPADRDDDFWNNASKLMAKNENEADEAIKEMLHAMLLVVNNQMVKEWMNERNKK